LSGKEQKNYFDAPDGAEEPPEIPTDFTN